MLDELLDRPFVLRAIEWLPQRLGDGGANLLLRTDDGEIVCTFVLDHRLEHAPDGDLRQVIDPDHPLLTRYVDAQAKLFFHGTAPTDQLLGALWTEHRAACSDWIAPHAYLRPDVLAAGHGLLAEGPRRLLDRYARVLASHGVEPSTIGDQPFQEWRGGRWQTRQRPPAALTFGRSFVVADSFSARRR